VSEREHPGEGLAQFLAGLVERIAQK